MGFEHHECITSSIGYVAFRINLIKWDQTSEPIAPCLASLVSEEVRADNHTSIQNPYR